MRGERGGRRRGRRRVGRRGGMWGTERRRESFKKRLQHA